LTKFSEVTSPNTHTPVPADVLKELAMLDTCTVSNAIERLNDRLRNEGFVAGTICCHFPHLPPMLGHAVTGRIRTSSPPMAGTCYYDRIDWWNYLASVPAPRVMVIEDIDATPGVGALVGEIHATIGQALNCVGCVTNGAVRDLAPVGALGFHLFSGSVAVSHAFAHLIEFGNPVEIGGLRIQSGDLVHGDRNGVHLIPLEVAGDILTVTQEILKEEDELIQFCRSPQFSLPELAKRMTPQRPPDRHSTLSPKL